MKVARVEPAAEQLADLLDFTPVPRACERFDGWTPDRQRGFIAALARLGTVKGAAASVGMAVEGVYLLRRAPGAEGFSDAWERALEIGVQHLADVAVERALNGVPVPIFYKGKRVDETRWYDNRLLMFMLQNRLSDQYGGRRGGGSARYAPPPKSLDDYRSGILKKVEAIRRGRLRDELWTPEKLAAYETLHGAEALAALKRELVDLDNPAVAAHPELFAQVQALPTPGR